MKSRQEQIALLEQALASGKLSKGAQATVQEQLLKFRIQARRISANGWGREAIVEKDYGNLQNIKRNPAHGPITRQKSWSGTHNCN